MAQDPFAKYRIREEEEEDPFSKYLVTDPEPVAEEIPEPEPLAAAPQEPNLWDKLTKPLWEAPSRWAGQAADYLDAPTLDSSPAFATMKGLGAGLLKGFGDTVSQATSPIDLAATVSTLGAGKAATAGWRGASALKRLAQGISGAPVAHGLQTVADPNTGMSEKGLGVAEILGGAVGMSGIGVPKSRAKVSLPSAATKVDDIIPSKPNVPSPAPVAAKSGLDYSIAAEKASTDILRQNGINPEGLSNRQIIEAADALKPKPPENAIARLPQDLQGAKPRFNIGKTLYQPQFESDLDKALYIISQKTPSKRDGDYLAYAMRVTGLDEAGVRKAGMSVRDSIRTTVSGAKPGAVNIPRIHQLDGEVAKVAAKPRIKFVGGKPDMADPTTARAVEVAGQRLKFGDEPVTSLMNPTTPLEAVDPDEFRLRFEPSDDPYVSKVITAAESKKPVPQGERIDPSVAIDIGDLPPNPRPGKLGEPESLLEGISGVPRALNSSFDMSFPFRQGRGLIHTKGWRSSWESSVRSFGSQATYDGLMQSINERPNFKPTVRISLRGKRLYDGPSFAEQSGLAIVNNLTNREEQIGSQMAEKIWGIGVGVKASNRAYNAFANKLRADVFDSLIEDATTNGLNPKGNLVLAKQIADYVNIASGRGKLGVFEPAAKILNNTLFSPKLMASRIQMISQLANPSLPWYVRKQYAKSVASTAGSWLTFNMLAKMGGMASGENVEISTDPDNSDFGKPKVGNTRFDPGASFQQFLVLFHRFASQEKASSLTGKTSPLGVGFKSDTEGDLLLDFINNKLAPPARLGSAWLGRSENKPFNTLDQVGKTLLPFGVQGAIGVMRDDPSLLPITMPLDALGINSQTYDKESFGKPELIPDNFQQFEMSFPRRKR